MKRAGFFIVISVAVATISFECNALPGPKKQEVKAGSKIDYPEVVKKVIDNKCYGCHNSDSRSEKGKEKLNWTTLPGLDKAAQVSKLDKVIEVLEKGTMPPKQMVERKPEAKISDAESKLLKEWAKATSDELLK
jgi:uncharacterized membrane protein